MHTHMEKVCKWIYVHFYIYSIYHNSVLTQNYGPFIYSNKEKYMFFLWPAFHIEGHYAILVWNVYASSLPHICHVWQVWFLYVFYRPFQYGHVCMLAQLTECVLAFSIPDYMQTYKDVESAQLQILSYLTSEKKQGKTSRFSDNAVNSRSQILY